MEGSELFRHAENWLNSNPGKTLKDYRIETGYSGPALKKRQRKGEPVRISYKGKSADSQTLRASREISKTEGEAANLRSTRRAARQRSQSTLHQYAYDGKPSIAEHDVRLASGGSNEYMSISDPDFKAFKDEVESKAPKDVVIDIDDVSGEVRAIPKKYHNKYQPTSQQPGVNLNPGDNILGMLRNSLFRSQSTPPKSTPKPKTKPGRVLPNFRNRLLTAGTLGTENHPMGGSTIDTDPLFGQGLQMRLP